MMETINFITYTNWSAIDYEHKQGNKLMAKTLQFDDVYLADSFVGKTKEESVFPVITLYRTSESMRGNFELDLKDLAYNYYFCGEATSGVIKDAIIKYLRATHKYCHYALYINSVSYDNLLFEDNMSILD